MVCKFCAGVKPTEFTVLVRCAGVKPTYFLRNGSQTYLLFLIPGVKPTYWGVRPTY